MLARLRKAQENGEGGFTLIELLVVIIIIGILAAIAIPTFLNQRQKGYDAAAKGDLKNMATAQETVLTETGSYTSTLADLTAAGFKASTDSVNAHTPVATGATSYTLSVCSRSGFTWTYTSINTVPVKGAACTF